MATWVFVLPGGSRVRENLNFEVCDGAIRRIVSTSSDAAVLDRMWAGYFR